jgi:hypothetical protein
MPPLFMIYSEYSRMPTVFGKTFSRRELARRVGDFSQLFGVELLSHSDGRERALRILRSRTGSGLSFDIMVDRAMDLGGMTFRGVPVGWCSPTGFRSPWLNEVDGENLVLERRIEVEVGTDTVNFHDRVRNLGFYPTPHALLYHINLGWPVVDKE